jgi:hypothetical protein
MRLSLWEKIGFGIGAAGVVGLAWTKARAASAGGPPLSTAGKGTISWWTDQDFVDFANMSARLRMNPADLLIVLYSESGLEPWAQNKIDGPFTAVGLNQITKSGASGWLSEPERQNLVNLSVGQQLPYVERYFRHIPWVAAGNTFHSAAQVYLAEFAPGLLGRGSDPNMVLYSLVHDKHAYEDNKTFDQDHKGYITLGDLGKWVSHLGNKSVFLAALYRLRQVTGNPNLSPVFS